MENIDIYKLDMSMKWNIQYIQIQTESYTETYSFQK